MNCLKIIIIILVIFFKTGNVLSENNIFNVNNIELIKKRNISNNDLANQAINKGFQILINKILLENDKEKLARLEFRKVKELVSYYQVSSKNNKNPKENLLNFNIYFDKEKFHKLFFARGISYSDINNKELYLLPILKKEEQIFIYNENYFYDNWNEVYNNDLIEFILPIENIEIIEKINSNKNDIFNLDLKDLFIEYNNENLALIFIEEKNSGEKKIYLKTRVLEKNINKNLKFQKNDLIQEKFNKKIIIDVSKEILNIIKSRNLIDIRVPSFLNIKFILNKRNNLVELNKRLKKIDIIDDIYVQEFNNKYVLIKMKYLGKLSKIIKQLEEQKILLKLDSDEWSLNLI